jgi:hypothetical protein
MEEPVNFSERVPYGSAYGLENLVAQLALKNAAVIALDEAFGAYGDFLHDYKVEDLAEHHANEEARRVFSRQSRGVQEPITISDRLPAMYADRYPSFNFLKNWVVTLSIVGWKLAQAESLPLSNVGEELALHLIIEDALAMLEDRAPDNPEAAEQLGALYEGAFEDDDFLTLYRLEDSDDLPDLDPTGQMGMTDLRFKCWFHPFGSGVDRGVPHPFLLDGQD